MAKKQNTHWFLSFILVTLLIVFATLFAYKFGRESIRGEAQHAVNVVQDQASQLLEEQAAKEEQQRLQLDFDDEDVSYSAEDNQLVVSGVSLMFEDDWGYGGKQSGTNWDKGPYQFYFEENREQAMARFEKEEYSADLSVSARVLEEDEDWESYGESLEDGLEEKKLNIITYFTERCEEGELDCDNFADEDEEILIEIETVESYTNTYHKVTFECLQKCTDDGPAPSNSKVYYVKGDDGVVVILTVNVFDDEEVGAAVDRLLE